MYFVLLDGVDMRPGVREPECAVTEASAELEDPSRRRRGRENTQQWPARGGVNRTAGSVLFPMSHGRGSGALVPIPRMSLDPGGDRLGRGGLVCGDGQRMPPRSKCALKKFSEPDVAIAAEAEISSASVAAATICAKR